jgi:death on curing protein
LESALAQPMHEHVYRQADLFQIAAAYAFHGAENQPSIDGNKRTGLLCALNFLEQNGISAEVPVDDYYDVMIGIAEKWLDKAGLAEIFRKHLTS